jgi:ATP-dependent DNA helicase RecG
MLLALDNGFQACLMAPTEILANQHFIGLSELANELNINIKILTGSTTSARKVIHEELENGNLQLYTCLTRRQSEISEFRVSRLMNSIVLS